jgi:hypothetical protein
MSKESIPSTVPVTGGDGGRQKPEPIKPPHEPIGETGDRFVLGVNLPWRTYGCDFGANAWQPKGGLARATDRAALETVFARLAADRMRWVRWFLLCDGRAGIVWDSERTPSGLDEHVLPDLGAALDLARRNGIQLVFVLFDFHWLRGARRKNNVRLGGHADVVADPIRRARLLDRIVDPILEWSGRSDAVCAWDVINEPEWVTRGFGARWWQSRVAAADMRAFIGAVVERIHARTAHQATVGLSNARGLPLVRGLGLDFYQVHWYDKHDAKSPLDRPVAYLELDRPLLLGEFPTKGSARSVTSILNTARSMGYAGAVAWSALSTDDYSNYIGHSTEIAAWRRDPDMNTRVLPA